MTARDFAQELGWIGPVEAIGELDLDLGAPFANERNVVLADDHPYEPRRAADDIAEQLALADEAPRQILGARQLQPPRQAGDDEQGVQFLLAARQRHPLALQVFLDRHRLRTILEHQCGVLYRVLAQARPALGGLRVESRIGHRQQHVTTVDQRLGGDEQMLDEAAGGSTDLGVLGHPDDAFGMRAQRQRHAEDEEQQQRQPAEGDETGTGAGPLQLRARQHIRQALGERLQEHRHRRPDRQDDADEEELAGNEEDDRDHHQRAVNERGGAVEEEPAALARARQRPLDLRDPKEVSLGKPLPVLVRAVAEVGNLDQVGQHVIAVVAQQRIAVEEQRRGAGDDHNVEGDRAQQAGFDGDPEEHREAGEEEFDEDAGSADQGTPPLAAKGAGGAGLDVGDRRQHQQHDAHLVHFATARLDRIAMPELVQALEQRIDQPEQQQVVRGQQLVTEVGGQLEPMHAGEDDRRQDDEQPEDDAGTPGQRLQKRPRARQEGVGVPQRDADRHRVDEALQEFLAFLLAPALAEFVDIGRQVGLQQVAGMQLREQPDHLVLRRRVGTGFSRDLVPDGVDRPLAVEQADDAIGAGAETVQLAGGAVVQDIPRLATEALALDAGVRTQDGPQRGDAVPRGAEERARHARRLRQPGPGLQAQPVAQSVRPDPGIALLAGVDLADAFHPRA
ncbi:MAG: hypothetical protein AW07_01168 [Candidatus Accumulibacter sp. SK-11]|nr:MAG: hypothetical protein AW07_01168 [Candidatus Accumulibacter sp. SK-11]